MTYAELVRAETAGFSEAEVERFFSILCVLNAQTAEDSYYTDEKSDARDVKNAAWDVRKEREDARQLAAFRRLFSEVVSVIGNDE
jgi:hypothetical protein